MAGFSLAEIVVALTISSMVMITVLTIYRRAQSSAFAATNRIEENTMVNEVLQRIAEDLDTILGGRFDATIKIDNKTQDGYSAGRLEIEKKIFNNDGEEEVFRRIVWQSYTNFETEAGGLILYRAHSGMTVEDKLLQRGHQRWELERFIPICDGVTYFSVEVVRDENLIDRWEADSLPPAIKISLSFAEPEPEGNELVVPEDQIASRTIAVDRTRKIRFDFTGLDIDPDADPNDIEGADPNEIEDTDIVETEQQTDNDR